MTAAARWVEQTLRYRFSDLSLLDRALTHRSADGSHNERLEFLGDAVLGLIIAERISRLLPAATEGYLTRLRALLVRRETLAEIGVEIRLGDWIRLGPGELKSGGFRRASTLANGIEAILGAVYLDSGLDQAREVVETLYGERLRALPAEDDLKDPKTRLQERLQARGLTVPTYAIEAVSGEAHKRHFRVSCQVAALSLRTEATGRSRREAEQKAAEAMIGELDDD